MSEADDFNHLGRAIEILSELQHHTVFVGALKQEGDRSIDFMQMLIGVSETGATIQPSHSKYLTIPMPVAGKRKAREIDGLFFYTTKAGKPSLARQENGKLVVYFLLAEQVRIPARHLLTNTVKRIRPHVAKIAAEEVSKVLNGTSTSWKPILNAVGEYVSIQMKRAMANASPKNAPITAANKGFNNPLIDTGAMQRSISWVVI
ncbi:hypothetical protein [Secundilactobacillus oryzae]|nr:hypothetical protein [Secundilactobacillus oryzae]